jgi:TolB-like protein/tetratricopeptide (TPR) repeat protein
MSIGRRVGRLFEQARRRRVFRVVGVYAVAAWAMIEVSSTVFPLLELPEWGPRMIVVLALLGFPLAVVLAWMFDLTPGGVVRTGDDDGPGEAPPVSPQRAFAGRAAGFFGLGILVALVTFAAYARFGPAITPGASTEAISSIAVLPFTDLSPAGDQAYFGDGMAEELLNRLVHVEGLRVAARTSSFAFKGKDEDIQVIGRQLGVESVVEGSIRKQGDSLRVTAQLIDARTGFHIWSETYDRSEASVFAIQDEISNAIVTQLRKQLAVPAGNATGGTGNVRAHELYLQGRALWNQRTDASVRQAVARFEDALNEDPDYALAWAGLAQAWSVLPALGDTPIEEAAARGNEAAARALAIDGQLAEAHAALGQMAQNFEWDLAAAEQAYRRATEFNPGYATAHQWYAEVSMLEGDTARARAEITEAVELDPLSPAALAVRAYLRAVTGDEEGALAEFHDLQLLYPSYANGGMNLALVALDLGRVAEARAALPAAAAGNAETAAAFRAVADAVADPARRGDAEAALTRIEASMPLSIAALWYAALGDDEAAMQRLERAGNLRADSNLPLTLLHPLLRGLRADPRLVSLARDVGVVLPGH